MTWPALEHERRAFEAAGSEMADTEAKTMSRGWIIKARFPNWPGHNISWFWVPIGNCTACRHYVSAGNDQPPSCTNPNAAIRERFPEYVNANDCPGFVAGSHPIKDDRDGIGAIDFHDVMKAAGLAPGILSQPVEILQKLEWTPWRSHQAHAQQEAFLSAARSNDYGQPERGHRQDLGDIEP